MEYKMSENIQEKDHIRLGGVSLVVDEIRKLGYVDFDTELTCHVVVSPSKKVVIGLPDGIPVKINSIR